MEFPLFKTKLENQGKKFNLANPVERREYFELKAGPEIAKLRRFLERSTFIAYLLGKKGAGKGTYTKLLQEIFGEDRIEHLSVGDMIRRLDLEIAQPEGRQKLEKFLQENYRGRYDLAEIMSSLEKRSTKKLLPTELILTLVKREIAAKEKKTFFIDGFPRDLDQISFTLFFRDLVGYRQDPDVFVLLDVPEKVIDERMKSRRVCPLCQTSRNLKLLPTSKIGYDPGQKEFYLLCDHPSCQGAKMVAKEGDLEGVEPIRPRLEKDGQLMALAAGIYGLPKIFLRNSLPVTESLVWADDYEITPAYGFQWDADKGEVRVLEESWVFPDDQGTPSVSLLAPAVVVSLLKQLTAVLALV